MKFILVICAACLSVPAICQFNNRIEPVAFTLKKGRSLTVSRVQLPSHLVADPTRYDKFHSPYVFSSSSEVNWAGSITTQSYNKGKLGTFYYWDLQGNLIESRLWLDIAGKNKRGLKLVFPTR